MYVNAWKTIKLNENTIKHFYRELLKYVDKDKSHRGEYKKQENKVYMIDEAGKSVGVLFDITPVYLTPKEMQELVDWRKNSIENNSHYPVLIIANFMVEFLNIYPFLDGNGRIFRLLTNLLLLKEGYLYMPYVCHEKLVEDNKPEYYIALIKSQKILKKKKPTYTKASMGRDNITPWLEFFLDILHEQSKQAVELLSHENIEKLLSEKQLAVWEYLKTVGKASPKEIADKMGMARPTVNQAMDKLMRLKKVERIGLGRSTRYRKIN
jgi:Fic family protein